MIHDKLNSNIESIINKWSKNITVTNYINDLHSVMYYSDAIIQINPIIPVAPTRIYGWSSLSPLLVANEDININFPELKDKENCYLGKSPKDYLEIFKNIFKENSQNNEIRKNFRKLYEDKWNYEDFTKSLEDIFRDFYIHEKIRDNYFQE